MGDDQDAQSGSKFRTTIRIMEVLIVPVVLGILAWSANNAGNKIAASQGDLAREQAKWNETMSSREQDRKDSELDTKYLELFGQYYFTTAPEKRKFAINIIDRVTNRELKKSLAVVAENDLKQNAPANKENAELQVIAQAIVQQTDTNWTDKPPAQAWCYQEDRKTPGAGQYLVTCHQTKDRCQTTKGPNPKTQQTDCVLVQGLDHAAWKPNPRGYLNSWYQYSDKPFPLPFPQF